jgi:hypothetical protein
MRHQPSDTAAPKLKYVDRPEITEAFADSLETVIFDGLSVRMEFVVNRFEPSKPNTGPTGSKVTAARLVLPLAGVVNLLSQLNSLMTALQQQGALSEVTLVQPQRELN